MNNTNMMNTNMGGYPNQMQVYGNNLPNQAPQFTQGLSVQQIREMKNKGGRFTIQLTDEEKDAARCTHKDPDRQNAFSLNDNGDGTVTCYICGARFALVDDSVQEVQETVQKMSDILETIKTQYLDMPLPVAQEMMLIIPLLSKVPKLFEHSQNCFSKYDVGLGNNNVNANPFATLGAVLGGGFYQQPGMGMGMNPGMGMQPNMMQPGMGMGMNPGMGMQPNMMQPGMGMQPNMQQPGMGMNPGMNMQPNMQQPGVNYFDQNSYQNPQQQVVNQNPQQTTATPPNDYVPGQGPGQSSATKAFNK